MTAPENPPAFPIAVPLDFQYAEPGMTLRDYFAGQALICLFASTDYSEGVAEYAYKLADAMLAARSAKGDA